MAAALTPFALGACRRSLLHHRSRQFVPRPSSFPVRCNSGCPVEDDDDGFSSGQPTKNPSHNTQNRKVKSQLEFKAENSHINVEPVESNSGTVENGHGSYRTSPTPKNAFENSQLVFKAKNPYNNEPPIVERWHIAVDQRPQDEQDRLYRNILREEEKVIKPSQLGVYDMNQTKDVKFMMNTPVVELIKAVRDRDGILQLLASHGEEKNLDEYKRLLDPFSWHSILLERQESLSSPLLLQETNPASVGIHCIDEKDDINYFVDFYSVRRIAQAVRDREDILQQAANLVHDGKVDESLAIIKPFHPQNILDKRCKRHGSMVCWKTSLMKRELDLIARQLRNLPRRVKLPYMERAAVMIALCNVEDKPCVILTRRSPDISFPSSMCLPGGMMKPSDSNVFETAARETEEEVEGLTTNGYCNLGGLRLNVGLTKLLAQHERAVTPVVTFVGDLSKETSILPKREEVTELVTVPLEILMDDSRWIAPRYQKPPIFKGGPYEVYGLTGYILWCFKEDVMKPLDENGVASSPSSLPSGIMPIGPVH